MNKFYNSSSNIKATICKADNCVTVYGETAKLINTIVGITAIFIFANVIDKALR